MWHETGLCGVFLLEDGKGPGVARTNDAQLMEEARLFERLYGPLRRFAAVVGPIEVDPDDLLQEAVARVLQHRRLTDLDEPGAYLRRTIVNLAANDRRRFARMRRALTRMGPGAGPNHPVMIDTVWRRGKHTR